MFNQLFEHLNTQQLNSRTLLSEALSAAEMNRIKAKIGNPDIRPGTFDYTLEAWLKRISMWGHIEIVHDDPEFRRKNKITQSKFIKLATDDQLLRMLGQWDIERKAINKVDFFREYIGVDGKRKKESFMITVKLNPEIKKALK